MPKLGFGSFWIPLDRIDFKISGFCSTSKEEVFVALGSEVSGTLVDSVFLGVHGFSSGENIPIADKSGSLLGGTLDGALASGSSSIFFTRTSRSSSCFLVSCRLLAGSTVFATETS